MRSLTFCVPLVLSTIAAAQTVHLVGPGGFANIQAAIAAAQSGDIVEVASGIYPTFTCDKSLTIAALPGAVVEIVPATITLMPDEARFPLPVGGMATVHGLRFESPANLLVVAVSVSGGTVAFDSCTFVGGLVAVEALRVENASAWLRDCALFPGTTPLPQPALRATNASITAVDCVFEGSTMTGDGVDKGGEGILATQSDIQLMRCVVDGGVTNGFCFYPGGDGLVTDRGDRCWIADSTVRGGDGLCGTGGTAVRNLGATAIQFARSQVLPGPGSVLGPAVVGSSVLDPAIVGLAAAAPSVLAGSTYSVDFQARANDLLIALATLAIEPSSPVLTVEVPWVVPGFFSLGTLAADPGGVATLQVAIPNVAGVQGTGIWFHAVNALTTPWRVSAPVGGVIR